ncbi:hypothetical protein ACIRRT_39885 [Streptomyces sp. NPDC102256]|uniref:hypothetical protein n=2 Tax=unclassified Streptomyces TaxID=2593676 RepID=UPI0013B917C3|nr:hypothetical protein [Streptomyces sp. SID14446]NEB33136.1 hypothetical protein [Streptomyces sp. SID14446]
MGLKMRLKCVVIGGAATLAMSSLVAYPAQADTQPPAGYVEVDMPADLEIVEATPASTENPAPSAAAASKATSHPCLGVTAVYGSTGCFQPYGDLVWSQDTESDGHSSVTVVHANYDRPDYACVNTGKAGSWGSCNKDYREDGDVRLTVLRYDMQDKKWYQPQATSDWVPVDGQ